MVSEDLICQKYTTIPLQFLHRNGIIHCRLWMSLMIPFMPNLLFSPPGDSVRLNCSVFCGKKPLKCKANWKINGRPLSPGQGYRQTHQKWAYSVLNLLSKISKSGVYSPQYVPFIQAHQMECVMQRIIRIWERPEKANMLPDLPNLRTSAPHCVSSFTTTVPGPLYSPHASSWTKTHLLHFSVCARSTVQASNIFTQPITTAIPFLFASYTEKDSGNSIATAVLSIDRASADDLRSEFTCFGEGPYHVKNRTVTLKQRGQRWVTVVLWITETEISFEPLITSIFLRTQTLLFTLVLE